MRERLSAGELLEETITEFEQRLSRRGLTGFDPEDAAQRNHAIHACVEASLEDLRKSDLDRFAELAILPEDAKVPFDVIEALWHETGDLDSDSTDDLITRLSRLSLLHELDRKARTLRLHDNMVWYLRDRIGVEGCRSAHDAIIRAFRRRCTVGWETLPLGDSYGWRFVIRHLRAAGQDEVADQLLTNYAWIKTKLRASSPRVLFESYLPEGRDEGVRLIGRAIGLSLQALAANPHELPRQVYGRLGRIKHVTAAATVAFAKQDADFRPAPRWPGLTSPGAERLRLIGHQSHLNSASFSPDDSRIITGSDDCTTRIWDVKTGQELAVLRGHEQGVRTASYSADGMRIVTVSDDRTVRIWEATTGQELAVLRGQEQHVRSASFSANGSRIITATVNGSVRLWDLSTGTEVAAPRRRHIGFVMGEFLSPDGARIVAAPGDYTTRLWDAETGQEVAKLPGYEPWAESASFSDDGVRIVTISTQGIPRLWDVATGKELAVLHGHEARVHSASFSPDGTHIVTASADGTAKLWDVTNGKELMTLRGHDAAVGTASFSRDGARIITASADGTAKLWDVIIGQESDLPSRVRMGSVTSVSFSPDGSRIVTSSEDGAARLWDARLGKELAVLGGHPGQVHNAYFISGLAQSGHPAPTLGVHSDGTCIVTLSRDGTAHLWDATTERKLTTLRSEAERAFFSHDARIVTASRDGMARLWNGMTGRQLAVLRCVHQRVLSAFFFADSVRIITGSSDGIARVFDVMTGHEIVFMRGHSGPVQNASFSPDGSRIVTASIDRTGRLWNAVTGQGLAVLQGHESEVSSAYFSPDGTCIVTGSGDRTARLWSAITGQELAKIALDAAVTAISVHSSTIALGDALGRVHVFETDEFANAEASAHGG
jgi:WD40 repeat protein